MSLSARKRQITRDASKDLSLDPCFLRQWPQDSYCWTFFCARPRVQVVVIWPLHTPRVVWQHLARTNIFFSFAKSRRQSSTFWCRSCDRNPHASTSNLETSKLEKSQKCIPVVTKFWQCKFLLFLFFVSGRSKGMRLFWVWLFRIKYNTKTKIQENPTHLHHKNPAI